MELLDDAKQHREILKKKIIFRFLMGLNKNLDEVQERILGIKRLSGICEVFSKGSGAESRKNVTLEEGFASPTNRQNSALATCDPILT